MNPRSLVLIYLLGVGLAPTALAQEDKPGPVVIEEDLGDGFRSVSVNGGPPAIIDDNTGLILKEIKGRPAVVDQEAGAFMFLSDDGEPVVKYYRNKDGGGDAKKHDPKMLDRMRAYMKRVQKHGAAMQRGKEARKKGKGEKKPVDSIEALLPRYMKLLALGAEEAEVIKPLLEGILRKQDEIRRSTVNLARKAKTSDLPAAIRSFLSAFRAAQKAGVIWRLASRSSGRLGRLKTPSSRPSARSSSRS